MATCWLLLQLAGMSAPLTLSAVGPAMAEELCTCPGVDHGALCPMHHTPSSRSQTTSTSQSNDDGRCRMQNACAPADAALLSLAGGTGVLAPVIGHHLPTPSAAPVITETAARLSHAYRPDAPPPRV